MAFNHYAEQVVADVATGRPLANQPVKLLDFETDTPVDAYIDGAVTLLGSGANGLVPPFQTLDTTRRVKLIIGNVEYSRWCDEMIPGSKGDKGDTGATGPAPSLAIGTVTKLAAGSTPTASFTGTDPYTLNLGLVDGADGAAGAGASGDVQFVASKGVSTTIPASTWSTYPLGQVDTNIGGGTWNASTYVYTIPKAGLYLCFGAVRITDGAATRSTAIGIGVTNADGPHVLWQNMGLAGASGRSGAQYTRLARFNMGDLVRIYIYSDGATFSPLTANPAGGSLLSLTKIAD